MGTTSKDKGVHHEVKSEGSLKQSLSLRYTNYILGCYSYLERYDRYILNKGIGAQAPIFL